MGAARLQMTSGSMPDLHIRPLTLEDAHAYWHLREEALASDTKAFGRDVEEHRATTVADTEHNLRSFTPGSFILGGFVKDALVCIAMLSRETSRKERHKAHIYGVYVSTAHRQKRYGHILLATLIDLAKKDATLEQLMLSVAAGQGAAYRLYRSLGFASFGTEPHALKVGSEYVDEEQMVLFLR